MTRNQIEYLALKETQRANAAREAETHRSNRATEDLTRKRDIEVQRSNLAKESISSDTLGETKRANLAKELETNRSNTAREGETTRSNLAHELETNRSNMVREAETARHNNMTETIQAIQAGANTVPGIWKPLGALGGLAAKVGVDAIYAGSQKLNTPKSNAEWNLQGFGVDKRSAIQKQMAAIAKAGRGNGTIRDHDPLGIIP